MTKANEYESYIKWRDAWFWQILLDPELDHATRSHLFAIGLHLNGKTRDAFPGLGKLAKKLHTSRSALQRDVQLAEKRGHLRIKTRKADDGEHWSNVYTPLVPAQPPQASNSVSTLEATPPHGRGYPASRVRLPRLTNEATPPHGRVDPASPVGHLRCTRSESSWVHQESSRQQDSVGRQQESSR